MHLGEHFHKTRRQFQTNALLSICYKATIKGYSESLTLAPGKAVVSKGWTNRRTKQPLGAIRCYADEREGSLGFSEAAAILNSVWLWQQCRLMDPDPPGRAGAAFI